MIILTFLLYPRVSFKLAVHIRSVWSRIMTSKRIDLLKCCTRSVHKLKTSPAAEKCKAIILCVWKYCEKKTVQNNLMTVVGFELGPLSWSARTLSTGLPRHWWKPLRSLHNTDLYPSNLVRVYYFWHLNSSFWADLLNFLNPPWKESEPTIDKRIRKI